jgi:hypothetical protein
MDQVLRDEFLAFGFWLSAFAVDVIPLACQQ